MAPKDGKIALRLTSPHRSVRYKYVEARQKLLLESMSYSDAVFRNGHSSLYIYMHIEQAYEPRHAMYPIIYE